MRLIKLFNLLLACAFQAGCAVTERGTTPQACPAIPVPEDSVLVGEENTPLPLLVLYPGTLSKNYSGCAYAWLTEDAKLNGTVLHSIARIEKGAVLDGQIADFIGTSMVSCAPADRQEHPTLCDSFDQFWRTSIDEPPPGKYTRKLGRPGN